MSSALIFGNAPKQSVGEMLPMSSGRKVLKLARHDVQVRKFMTAPGLGPITALCFKATIRTASSDREVLAPMSDQEPGRTSIGSLPLDQWRHARVEAIEVQEVEGVVDHPFITVWLEVRVLPGPPRSSEVAENSGRWSQSPANDGVFVRPVRSLRPPICASGAFWRICLWPENPVSRKRRLLSAETQFE